MSRENNPLTVYLSDEEKAQLKEWSNQTGKSLSELGREAITEYTDYDKLQRIDEKLDRVLTLVENQEHTRTRDTKQPESVPEKARTIAKRLYENHDSPIKESDVEIAIEDIAGGDSRTVEKYKSQLKKRQLLFKHPLNPVWTTHKDEWVSWVENATVVADISDYTEEYNMAIDEYFDLAEGVVQ